MLHPGGGVIRDRRRGEGAAGAGGAVVEVRAARVAVGAGFGDRQRGHVRGRGVDSETPDRAVGTDHARRAGGIGRRHDLAGGTPPVIAAVDQRRRGRRRRPGAAVGERVRGAVQRFRDRAAAGVRTEIHVQAPRLGAGRRIGRAEGRIRRLEPAVVRRRRLRRRRGRLHCSGVQERGRRRHRRVRAVDHQVDIAVVARADGRDLLQVEADVEPLARRQRLLGCDGDGERPLRGRDALQVCGESCCSARRVDHRRVDRRDRGGRAGPGGGDDPGADRQLDRQVRDGGGRGLRPRLERPVAGWNRRRRRRAGRVDKEAAEGGGAGGRHLGRGEVVAGGGVDEARVPEVRVRRAEVADALADDRAGVRVVGSCDAERGRRCDHKPISLARRCVRRPAAEHRRVGDRGVEQLRPVVGRRVDRVGERQLRVVERQRQVPAPARAVELPARAARRDLLPRLVEDGGREDTKAGARGTGSDGDAPVNPQLRLELSGPEPPAPDVRALPLVDGQELLDATLVDDDRLAPEGCLADATVPEAAPVAAGRVRALEPEPAEGGADDVAGAAELDAHARGRRVAIDRRLRTERSAKERRSGNLLASRPCEQQAGRGDGCENADEDGAHGQPPGRCRAIRRPQFFVGRHVLDCAFPHARRGGSARITGIDLCWHELEKKGSLKAIKTAEDHPSGVDVRGRPWTACNSLVYAKTGNRATGRARPP